MSEEKKKDPSKANLIPFTKTNAAEMGRRGGLAAQKTIRKKKKMRDCLKTILALSPGDRNKQKLAELGIPDDQMTNEMLLAVSMFQKAIKGDVRAAEYIRDLTGQQPVTKLDQARTRLMLAQAKQIESNSQPDNELTKLDELLASINKLAEEPNEAE